MGVLNVKGQWLSAMRRAFRWFSGDLAYAAYLDHWYSHHRDETDNPLSRKDFFRERTLRKWRGINRCC